MIGSKIKGVLALSSSALLLLGISILTPTASWSDDAAGDQDGATTNTSSTLDTQEKCTWYVTGIPGSVALDVAEGSGTNGKYDGTTLDLTKTLDSNLTAYTSGNGGTGTADANSECTFYNSKTGISITNSISTYSVAGKAEGAESSEDGMSYDLASDNPLSITYSEGTCWSAANSDEESSGWTIANASLYGVGHNSATVMSLAFSSTAQVNSTTSSERCSSGAVYAMKVPANREPASPGSNYVFTGPTVTFGITLPNS